MFDALEPAHLKALVGCDGERVEESEENVNW